MYKDFEWEPLGWGIGLGGSLGTGMLSLNPKPSTAERIPVDCRKNVEAPLVDCPQGLGFRM